METDQKPVSRKKFVLIGLAILAFFTAMGGRFFSGKTTKRTVKMLTQDGKLVEVDESALSAQRKKISKAELQTWVKK